MYAQPELGPSPYKPSPTRSIGAVSNSRPRYHQNQYNAPVMKSSSSGPLKRRHSEHSLPQVTPASARSYPKDPIASLTIISTRNNPPSSRPSTSSGVPQYPLSTPKNTNSESTDPNSERIMNTDRNTPPTSNPYPQPQTDRLPLWALAPGMNVLQGSTSASIGIKLGDFSAINLLNGDHEDIDSLGKALVGHRSRLNHHAGEVWIDSSPLKSKTTILVPPLMKPPSRPSTPASRIMDDNSDARSIRSVTSQKIPLNAIPNQHLTPPEAFTPPNLFSTSSRSTKSQPFPRLARIPHWKRGRKELPEDVLEDLGKGLEVEGVIEGMRNLGMWDLEHSLHADRARRASEDRGGILLKSLR